MRKRLKTQDKPLTVGHVHHLSESNVNSQSFTAVFTTCALPGPLCHYSSFSSWFIGGWQNNITVTNWTCMGTRDKFRKK